MINFTCPSCKLSLRVPPGRPGATLACPTCKAPLTLPSAAGGESNQAAPSTPSATPQPAVPVQPQSVQPTRKQPPPIPVQPHARQSSDGKQLPPAYEVVEAAGAAGGTTGALAGIESEPKYAGRRARRAAGSKVGIIGGILAAVVLMGCCVCGGVLNVSGFKSGASRSGDGKAGDGKAGDRKAGDISFKVRGITVIVDPEVAFELSFKNLEYDNGRINMKITNVNSRSPALPHYTRYDKDGDVIDTHTLDCKGVKVGQTVNTYLYVGYDKKTVKVVVHE